MVGNQTPIDNLLEPDDHYCCAEFQLGCIELLTLGACAKGYSYSCLVCLCVCVCVDEITFHVCLCGGQR